MADPPGLDDPDLLALLALPDDDPVFYPFMPGHRAATLRKQREDEEAQRRRQEDENQRWLQDWLASVEHAPSSQDEDDPVRPPAKRARRCPPPPQPTAHDQPYDGGDDFDHPYNAASPPLTNLPPDTKPADTARPAAPATPTTPASKMPAAQQDTPPSEAHSQAPQPNDDVDAGLSDSQSHDSQAGNKRKRRDKAALPPLTTVPLDQLLAALETPFIAKPAPLSDNVARHLLPRDIHTLFSRILRATAHLDIIPHEIRDEAISLGVQAPTAFRPPDGSDGQEARRLLDFLCDIIQLTHETSCLKRHETGWNTIVHGPLLHRAFTYRALSMPSILVVPDAVPPQARVRCEPVMQATIVGSCIPLVPGDGQEPQLACDVSASSSDGGGGRADAASVSSRGTLSGKHSRSHSKQVDFVLALDLADDVPLSTTIGYLHQVDAGLGRPRHINQTAYKPLTDSLIAVSVETKAELAKGDDPRVQLGVWSAAWYKRMYQLRQRLGVLRARRGRPPSSSPFPPPPRLVSMPLIQVVGHEWSVYFACDSGSRVFVYGPTPLGSTLKLDTTYALFRSLEAIRDWVLTDFRSSMEAWFMCNPGPAEASPPQPAETDRVPEDRLTA